jgi:hypothetical protein
MLVFEARFRALFLLTYLRLPLGWLTDVVLAFSIVSAWHPAMAATFELQAT